MSAPLTTHVYFLLDRSGSMASITEDVIGGFNEFVKEQQGGPNRCRFTLVQFDSTNQAELIHDAVDVDGPTKIVLTKATFRPRGMTPLLDATDLIITRAERRAEQRAKKRKAAEAIVVVTFTDGLENDSRRVTAATLKARIEQLTEAGWRFLYLGANQDSYAESSRIGYGQTASADWDADSVGTHVAYAASGVAVSNLRRSNAQGTVLAATADFFVDETPVDDEGAPSSSSSSA